MSNDNNIKNFNATDIERYHKGLLSAKEMNALEKAALDDPFLADALEGYGGVATDIRTDIKELEKRLAEKTGETKVIPMYASGKSSFPWLRVAVLVILIAGAGLLSYEFLFNSKPTKDLATNTPKQSQPSKDSGSANLPSQPNNDDLSVNTNSNNSRVKDTNSYKKTAIEKDIAPKQLDANASITVDPARENKSGEIATVPAIGRKDEKNNLEEKILPEIKTEKLDTITFGDTKSVLAQQNTSKDKEGQVSGKVSSDDFFSERAVTKNQNTPTAKRAGNANRSEGLMNFTAPNIFRGLVTDANNNALPFANITNTRDNVGTYTDARGYFTLASPSDSVLNVQVKVVGFENTNVQLRNSAGENQITMREDRSLASRYVDTVKRDYAKRSREATMTFDEPEPEAGWDYYGSYLVNNLVVPDNLEMKRERESSQNVVEVSFEISKNGDPIKIKVEKSLCDKCDKEAIRLIQNGPKFKSKTKKGKRTTVKVPFPKVN